MTGRGCWCWCWRRRRGRIEGFLLIEESVGVFQSRRVDVGGSAGEQVLVSEEFLQVAIPSVVGILDGVGG